MKTKSLKITEFLLTNFEIADRMTVENQNGGTKTVELCISAQRKIGW